MKTIFKKGIYCNREYSWLQFNKRVLEEARDKRNPLFERCKFLSITTSNLDEFFMVRVGSLSSEAIIAPNVKENKTELTPNEQVDGILKVTKDLYREITAAYKSLNRELKSNGICVLKGSELSARQEEKCVKYFYEGVLPLLSPMVLDAKHPMINLENNRLYMIAELEKNGRACVGVTAISPQIPRLHRIEGSGKVKLITSEELVAKFGHLAFNGYGVKSSALVRVTRNADFDASVDDRDVEHDFDFSEFLRRKVELRGLGLPVRVEYSCESEGVRTFVQKALGIKNKLCFKVEHYFDYKFLFALPNYLPKETSAVLKYPSFRGTTPPELTGCASLIDEIRRKDAFLAYPYNSMDALVRLLEECAEDRRVASIKITIYRLDSRSRIAEALKRASENGKEVTVVIELCARFDEENNLHYASLLQEAGCTIIYGMKNYKVHSKIISIVLSEGDNIEYITHLGTGNYNESTSRLYTDLNVITANREIGEDAVAFFRNVAICNTDYAYKRLLIAPVSLKKGLIALIERETEKARRGESAQILAKMNSLTDKEIMSKLVEASMAGVKIRLNVRGICCLVPGIAGKTENISVISIVGRFLEHSRIYCFGSGEDRKIYISSADLMTRNTNNRVEIATPLLDSEIADRVYNMLETILSDNQKARKMLSDGTYTRAGELTKSANQKKPNNSAKSEKHKADNSAAPIDSQSLFLSGKF